MFGWLKKRMLARMATSASVARIVTFRALSITLEIDSAESKDKRAAIARSAGARTNFLFGSESTETHVENLDLGAEHQAAIEWLETNTLFRELVVQTRRVESTVRYGQTGSVEAIGGSILANYGREFPDAPNPESYAALVKRAIDSLPERERAQFNRWRRNA